MLKRILKTPVLIAALALAGVIMAGCGGSSSSGSTTNAVDRAFVQQMIPHHMMAIQMAQTADQQGDHPQIKTLATSIIGDQRAEITEMTGIAKQIGVKPDPMPMGGHMHMEGNMAKDAQALGISMDQMGMSMNMDSLNGAKPFDRAFVDMMIPHHQGAVRMAHAELAKGKNPALRAIAKRITAAQDREIGEMNTWRKQWYGSTSPAGGVPTA